MEGNNKGEMVVEAIIKYEGWRPANEATKDGGSRSFRNNNPGNLRSSPFELHQVDGFSRFTSVEVGRKALVWDLKKKSLGQTVTDLNGESTLSDLIRVYAPVTDGNDTDKYIEFVLKETGLRPDVKLSEIFADVELPVITKTGQAGEVVPEQPIKTAPEPAPAECKADEKTEIMQGTYKISVMSDGEIILTPTAVPK